MPSDFWAETQMAEDNCEIFLSVERQKVCPRILYSCLLEYRGKWVTPVPPQTPKSRMFKSLLQNGRVIAHNFTHISLYFKTSLHDL
jgi:hypothetical protein